MRGKKGSRRFWRERRENVVFKDVKTMSVVSDKQRQAGSSGSAPATPQGNNLPPAVPPPSISRNPLRGSKCNSLHCDYSSLPRLPYFLYHIFSLERNLMRCVGKLTISVFYNEYNAFSSWFPLRYARSLQFLQSEEHTAFVHQFVFCLYLFIWFCRSRVLSLCVLFLQPLYYRSIILHSIFPFATFS